MNLRGAGVSLLNHLAGARASVRRKIMVLVVVVALTALCVMAAVMMAFDLGNYHDSLVNELSAQADLLGRTTATALSFDDPAVARENLGLLRVTPKITAAAIYSPQGTLFATYAGAGGDAASARFPPPGQAEGYRVEGSSMVLFHPIRERGEILGTVYLRAKYEWRERLLGYLGVLVGVLALSLMVAVWMSSWLEGTVTQPIQEVAEVAGQVMTRRDYSLRVKKMSDDEVGFLVDTFNAMLAEVGQRSEALEKSHLELENEMQFRRKAEEDLRLADRRKDEFLATLAHELRNPLAPIANGLAMLRMSPDKPDAALRARQMMERQLLQLTRLVDDLLDVSRITTGKIDLKVEQVEFRSVIQSAVETATPMIERRRHTLQVDMPEDGVMLRADATRIAQVFLNLLNNAAKFTPEGGTIRLQAQMESPERVRVTVADNGIGISPDMQSMIFEMFAQVNKALDRSTAGLGVGLALARHLVEMHGGSIEAHSAGLGQGAQFVVRLPAAVMAAKVEQAPKPTVSDMSLRILVADDNRDAADSLGEVLGMLGAQARVVYSGQEALDAFAQSDPSVVILDIGMPLMDGYAVARAIRERFPARRPVLVALTGWGQQSDREQARQAGFDHHLTKPADIDTLEALFREIRRGAAAH